MRLSAASHAVRFVRWLFLGALFAATLEICVRAEASWRWGAPFWGPYSSDQLRVADARGTRNRPGARFEKWSINSAGFRGPEVAVEKATGVVRVGVAGASEIFGLYESPDMDVTSQLRSRLGAAAPGRFEVVNLASAGMSPPRIKELLEKDAFRFGFDIVIVYPAPAFYLDIEPPRRTPRPTASASPSAKRLPLRLPDRLWSATRARIPAWFQAWLKRASVARERSAHPPDWVWNAAPPERVALFAADLTDVVLAIQRLGAQPLLATHANRFSSPLRPGDAEQMDGWIRFYPRATAECLIDMERQANEALHRIGREHRVPVIEVDAAVGKDPRNYADFSHFTDDGAARAARAMAATVLESTAASGAP